MTQRVALLFYIFSRKASESVSDGTIDHLPSRQVSQESQNSIKEITRRYPRVRPRPEFKKLF